MDTTTPVTVREVGLRDGLQSIARTVPTADKLLWLRAAYYAGADGRAKVRLTITDEQGRERLRQFVILRKDVADDDPAVRGSLACDMVSR